jgi:hypothetical protein
VFSIVCILQHLKRLEAEQLLEKDEALLRKQMGFKQAKEQAEKMHMVNFYHNDEIKHG